MDAGVELFVDLSGLRSRGETTSRMANRRPERNPAMHVQTCADKLLLVCGFLLLASGIYRSMYRIQYLLWRHRLSQL